MDDVRSFVEYMPFEAREVIGYKGFDSTEFAAGLLRDKLPVWINDKKYTKLTDAYMEDHFLGFVNTVDEFDERCKILAAMERRLYKTADTRYNCRVEKRILIFPEDIVRVSDITVTPENLARAEEALRKGVETPRGTMILDGSYKDLPPPKPQDK